MTNINGTLAGCWFESRIFSSLMFDKSDEIRILRNKRVFSYKLNRVTEIDLLVITPYGLYSIEAKAFKTLLQGNIGDTLWIGKTGKYKTRLYSPFIQNNEHIRSLKNMMRRNGVKPPPISNIICVPNTCKVVCNYSNVMNLNSLVYKIDMDSIIKKHIYDVELIYNLLKDMEG